jgi:TPR repeat protein
MVHWKWILLSCGLVLSACAQPPQRETIRICDSAGCRDVPRNQMTQMPDTVEHEADDGRIAALVALAEREPAAAYDLGLRYFRGDGVGQDGHKALTWMRSAAERGHLEAQKALGRLYLTGLEEMGPDPGEAERWLSITAGRGDTEALALLAEARAARRSEESEWKWRQHQQAILREQWYRQYRYYGHWRSGRWYYR